MSKRTRFQYTVRLSSKQLDEVTTASAKERCFLIALCHIDFWDQVLCLTTADGNKYKLKFAWIYDKEDPEKEIPFENVKIVASAKALQFNDVLQLGVRDIIQLWQENYGL